jgi:RNA polymerase sigma-70 factor (ECF subfamily)
MQDLSDEKLMEGYKMGSTACLEEIFNRYKSRLFNYSFRLLSHRADSEEAVSEVFFTLTQKKDSYTPNNTAKFSTWLYRVAHNVCVDLLRKRNKIIFPWHKREQNDDNLPEFELTDNKDLPDKKAQDSDCADAVLGALNKLPQEMKEAMILREYQGLNYDDISKVMDCTLEKVKVLIFRAREKLRVELLPFVEEADNV